MWIRRTDSVIAISNSSKDEIVNNLDVSSNRVDVVSNAVDKKIFYQRTQQEIETVRLKYNLKEKYFLYIGNIEPRKNITTLINAFRKTQLQDDAQLFLVGGDGWLNEDVYSAMNIAEEEGYSVLKNKTYVPDEDLPALMSGAVALVQPSWHEGFGLATIQSLACGTPKICSNIPGLQEATKGNEHLVTFFDPSDIDHLSAILKEHIVSPRPKQIGQVLSWEDSVKVLINVLNERGE
jgi:glycosyltransferase involved in cell wall biosynthesis